MIINRYIQRNIHFGTLGALAMLVSIGLFFLFVGELDDIGQGNYGVLQALGYVALSAPARIVEFMPLAVLLGSILSLGALAGNSEIIAMQASGISLRRMLAAVLQAALVLAALSFLIADWLVPDSEAGARALKNQAQQQSTALQFSEGLWIKDESRVVHIEAVLPNGYARKIEIYQLDDNGNLVSSLRAEHAVPLGDAWELQQVEQTIISARSSSSRSFDRMIYEGNLSHKLLQVLIIEPRIMSSMNLYSYLKFLDENGLDGHVERLIFWQKMLAPATIVIMCLLGFPFVLGSQRQSNTGQRLLTGILLGLVFVVLDRLLTQLGTQLSINAFTVALLPNLIFLALAIHLLLRKQSHGAGIGMFLAMGRRRYVDDPGAAEPVMPGVRTEKPPQVTDAKTNN
ncbi:MAG: LPS export ABC transporter permease LptG [Gammaproteobacteria bacterium]|nr:LPS export ABC transporter permease LptG [Gammaproteobacteria bacterium]MDH3449808.1 LPS export ABC transporter permease LptG [Gammaproteobacteria bacterium]